MIVQNFGRKGGILAQQSTKKLTWQISCFERHHLTLISNEWPKLRLLPFNWYAFLFKDIRFGQLSIMWPKTKTGLTFQLFFNLLVEDWKHSEILCQTDRLFGCGNGNYNALLYEKTASIFLVVLFVWPLFLGREKNCFMIGVSLCLKSEMDSFTSFPALVF